MLVLLERSVQHRVIQQMCKKYCLLFMNFYCKTKPIIDVKIFSNNIKFIQADEQYIKL